MDDLSLEELSELGFDIGSKYDFRTRDNVVVSDDEDEEPEQ